MNPPSHFKSTHEDNPRSDSSPFIQTGYRTAFSYLTKPLADNMARAFMEE